MIDPVEQGFAPRLPYDCNGKQDTCTKSITYDDWHCDGCKLQGESRLDKTLIKIVGKQN